MAALTFRHLLSMDQAGPEDLETILALAERCERAALQKSGERFALPPGRIMANLFFEASTRTRFSFAGAMHRLGGQVIGLEEEGHSSLKKGESLEDTGRIVSAYADVIVFRHAQAGSAERLAAGAEVPVINAGDGPHEHPTQSLTDLYALRRAGKDPARGLSVAFYGDLRYSRTAYPLMRYLSQFPGRIVLVAPPGLEPEPEKLASLRAGKAEIVQALSPEPYIAELDAMYVTRVQRERLSPGAGSELPAPVTPVMLRHARPDMQLLHPLPRVDEISPETDALPQAKYFEQARGGLYVRMALLLLMTPEG